MPQSLSKVYIHLVFHVKTMGPQIRDKDLERTFSYIGKMINETGCHTIKVGGMNDHIHVLYLLSRDVSLAHVAEKIKSNTSRWIKTIDPIYNKFAWQGGYGVFSVGQSSMDNAINYIANQREHHTKYSFQEEYLRFLNFHGIKYNEEYVFRD